MRPPLGDCEASVIALSDFPPREQERYFDGITMGIGTREVGRPASDRDRLDLGRVPPRAKAMKRHG
jgi:hypothetical protein